MESHEVHPGMAVQVREDRSRPEFEGMLGIIRRSYGAPDYLAVEVEFKAARKVEATIRLLPGKGRRPANPASD